MQDEIDAQKLEAHRRGAQPQGRPQKQGGTPGRTLTPEDRLIQAINRHSEVLEKLSGALARLAAAQEASASLSSGAMGMFGGLVQAMQQATLQEAAKAGPGDVLPPMPSDAETQKLIEEVKKEHEKAVAEDTKTDLALQQAPKAKAPEKPPEPAKK